MDLVEVNKVFHDHECSYYDERFAIVHDAASARRALGEVEGLLCRPLRAGEVDNVFAEMDDLLHARDLIDDEDEDEPSAHLLVVGRP